MDVAGPGKCKLRDAIWEVSQDPHCLLTSGLLDPQLKVRFKGDFLARDGTAEMRRLC